MGNLSVLAAFVPKTWKTTMKHHADENELSAMLLNAAGAGTTANGKYPQMAMLI